MSMRKHRARQQYPQGKLNEHDEGVINIAVAADLKRQVLVVQFPERIRWFAMPKREAIELANLITKRALELADVPAVNSPPADGTQ